MKIEVFFEGKKKVIAHINGFTVSTDQPVLGGGDGSAPTPFDLFLASLATCAGIYVKGFCDQRGISSEGIRLFQDMEYDQATSMINKVNIEIQVPADFPEKYRDTLITVAGKCKVKKHMQQPPEFNVYTSVK
ncbi:MAG: OsmC family protein [Bacteroidota bacterium]